MAMRLKSSALLAASLFLCACAEGGRTVENSEDLNQIAAAADDVAVTDPGSADSDALAPGEPSGPQRPGNGSETPEPSGNVTLAATPAETSAGATMSLTLRNGSRERIGYNLCTSAIVTSTGRSVDSDRVCTMELRTLNSGASANYSYELPDDLADGTYRFVTQVERMESGGRSSIRSTGFRVR
jgi:hypothetical protein